MYINGTNISNYGASILESKRGVKRQQKHISLINNKYIKDQKNIEGFEYSIKVLVKANNKVSLERNISILSRKLADCSIRERDFDFIYDAILQGGDVEEYNYDVLEDKEMAVINYTFLCIDKYEDVKTIEFKNDIQLILNNTEKTPCILELTPTINLVDVKITGLGEDITIKNITKDKKIIIDGEKGLVLEEGQNKWKDYDSWSFPKLTPGVNEISINKASINAKLSYKARWI